MRHILADYFYYSRGERNGVTVLAALVIIVLGLSKICVTFGDKPTEPLNTIAATVLTDFERQASAVRFVASNSENHETPPFTFDPNIASQSDFIRLGLSPRVALTIEHYREKGGQFRRKEDFKKIYGLKADDYERLAPYINISDGFENPMFFDKKHYPAPPQLEMPQPSRLFAFDPNTATDAELTELGLDNKVIHNIIKYRTANGKFYKKEDFKKIYALSEIDYLRLENYIQIADNKRNTDNKLYETQKYTSGSTLKAEQSLSVDVNQATTDEWQQLRGIGSVLATRICEYRDKLGGFVSLDQLKDVYGLPDSTYYSIIPSLRLSPVSRKLHINKASITELTHPYLSRKQVDVIRRYRLNHGAFYSMEDIKKTGVFTDDNLKKLKPYLDFTQ